MHNLAVLSWLLPELLSLNILSKGLDRAQRHDVGTKENCGWIVNMGN